MGDLSVGKTEVVQDLKRAMANLDGLMRKDLPEEVIKKFDWSRTLLKTIISYMEDDNEHV